MEFLTVPEFLICFMDLYNIPLKGEGKKLGIIL